MSDPVRGYGSGRQAVDRAMAFFGEIDDLRAEVDQPMLAEPWERLLARSIDISLVMLVFYVLTSFYLYPGAERPPQDYNEVLDPPVLTWTPPPADVPTLVAQTLFFAGLFVAYELAASAVLGVTAGKRILGLDVHDERGRRLPWRRLAVRTCPWALIIAFAWLLFGTSPASAFALIPLAAAFVMVLRDDRRQTWYDRLARTTVVKPR